MNWRFSRQAGALSSSIIREILKLTQKSDIISFAGGVPEPRLFPIPEITEVTIKVLKNNVAQALQYGITEGYLPLRELLAERMQGYGIKADADNILITQGSQQGLDLLGRIFFDPGDTIITELPTYLGFIQSSSAYQVKFRSIHMDDEGLQVDHLEELLCQNLSPKLLYVLPNFQNPSGVTLSLERRRQLSQLSLKYSLPIIEDDPYFELRYDGEHIPHLSSMECAENCIFLNTISKIITPGHRLGWVVAPKEVIRRLVQAKQAADLHTNSFSQRVIYEYCAQGYLDGHIKYLCQEYVKKRDAMLEAIEKYFPPQMRWTKPQGGLFVWATLPEGVVSSQRLLERCVDAGVAFVPGSAFYPDGDGNNAFRLSFSTATEEEIEVGIKRLAGVLWEVCQEAPSRLTAAQQ